MSRRLSRPTHRSAARRAVSRAEHNALARRVRELADLQQRASDDLAVQFTRIAQLQAELDQIKKTNG